MTVNPQFDFIRSKIYIHFLMDVNLTATFFIGRQNFQFWSAKNHIKSMKNGRLSNEQKEMHK